MCILRTKNVLCLNFIFAIEQLLHSKIFKKVCFLLWTYMPTVVKFELEYLNLCRTQIN